MLLLAIAVEELREPFGAVTRVSRNAARPQSASGSQVPRRMR
jgi:hypothetical protein